MLPETVETMPSTRETLAGLLAAYARQPVRRIMVVGNAPLSPSAERAKTIDAADLVMRTTSFALDRPGAEPAYGTRVDVVLLHRGTKASPWLFQQYRRRLYLLAEPGRLHWEPEQFPDWWPSDMGYLPISNREWTVPLCRLAGMDVRAEPTWTTTGTLGIYVLTELFPDAQTCITGFSIIEDAAQSVFSHAWGAPVEVTHEHRLDREQALLRRWLAAGRITALP